jgi:hypothetical protein
MTEILLFALVPAIVIGTILYALLGEVRDNRTRRERWEARMARARLRVRPSGRPVGTP